MGVLSVGMFDSAGDFFSSLKDLGEDVIQNKLDSRYQGDHISAQNDATAEIGRLLSRFQSTLPHTDNEYFLFEDAIQNVADRFSSWVTRFNNSRASRGAQEVNTLAHQIIADREQERQSGSQRPGLPGEPRYPWEPAPGASVMDSIPSWAWLAGGGLVLYTLTKRRRF